MKLMLMAASASFILLWQGVSFAVTPSPEAKSPASLDDVIGLRGSFASGEGVTAKLRAIREAGMAAGAQAGFESRSSEIRRSLDTPARQSALDGIFMFQPLIDSSGLLPPVISEVDGSLEYSPGHMVISGQVFRIERAERFVQIAPTWREYLLTGMAAGEIESVPKGLIPKDTDEKAEWEAAVRAGWSAGVSRADVSFAENLARLKRDYIGMLRYRRLLLAGAIQKSVVARSTEAIKATETEVALDVETRDVVAPARMESDVSMWKRVD